MKGQQTKYSHEKKNKNKKQQQQQIKHFGKITTTFMFWSVGHFKGLN